MRLIRGSVEGLGGMREDTPRKDFHLWRPLLSEDPADLKAFLRAESISWAEDESNRDDRYLRNFLRLRILPALEERQKNASAHIAGAAAVLREESDFLDAFADRCLHGHAHFGRVCPFVKTEVLDAQAPAIRRRMIRLFLLGHGAGAESAHLAAASAMRNGDTVNLPAGFRLLRTPGYLHLIACKPIPAPVPPEPADFSGFGDGKRTQAMPAALFSRCTLRYREDGDRIVPFGMRTEKSLQDYLVDRKIDEPWRDRIPLLCRGHEVLWAGGVGTGNIPVWSENETNLRMTWHGTMPWAEQGDSFSPRSASAGAVAK
jgi:tRNA(Ile)-lysidine synthase